MRIRKSAAALAVCLVASLAQTPAVAQVSIPQNISTSINEVSSSGGYDFGVTPGISPTQIVAMALSFLKGGRSESESPTFADHQYKNNPVTMRWLSKEGKKVVLRKEQREKIIHKHNLPVNASRYITQAAPIVEREGETRYLYYLPINKMHCGLTIFSCKVVESRDLLTVVDYRNVDGDPMGVVTTYCPWTKAEGLGARCPDWVNRSPQLQ